ncbi:MAG TPA: phosphoglycerate kinase [Thiotrichaceae bacterium]|jgi:phosphoglycerate kinase|nr:phosphoglycerate kinase [Thiotrichaceae bacterium]
MSVLVKIADLDLSGKTVLIREDYNVPIKDGVVTSDVRIRATLPTLKQVLEAGAKIILVSHFGRPVAGKYNDAFSLAPVAKCLSDFLEVDVPVIKDWVDGIDMEDHQVVLCENVRFEAGETKNDDELARKMAQLCQVYINDAFATAHRAQASTHGVAKYAAVSAAGPLLINELKSLSKALREPAQPIIAIVGGAKVSSKLTVLETLSEKVDQLIVGGGIVNTFLKAAGYEVGKSLYEPDLIETASKLIKQAEENGCQIPLPVDVICGKEFNENTKAVTKSINDVEADDMIMDVGPETSKQLNEIIAKAKTIVWNGPLGVFEFDQFSQGTESLAKAIANSEAYSIAGGGDTIAAISKFDVEDKISYISTGGGAFLEFLEGKKLPAVDILEEAARAWTAMEKAREL